MVPISRSQYALAFGARPHDMLSIRGFIRPNRILRFQASVVEQLLQLIRRQRLLPLVDTLETNPSAVKTLLTSRHLVHVGLRKQRP